MWSDDNQIQNCIIIKYLVYLYICVWNILFTNWHWLRITSSIYLYLIAIFFMKVLWHDAQMQAYWSLTETRLVVCILKNMQWHNYVHGVVLYWRNNFDLAVCLSPEYCNAVINVPTPIAWPMCTAMGGTWSNGSWRSCWSGYTQKDVNWWTECFTIHNNNGFIIDIYWHFHAMMWITSG